MTACLGKVSSVVTLYLLCLFLQANNVDLPQPLSAVRQYFRALLVEKESAAAANPDMEVILEESQPAGSSLASRILWSLPPFWVADKGISAAKSVGGAVVDISSTLAKMLLLETMVRPDIITEVLEITVSKVLHQLSKYVALDNVIERVESSKETINCEVSITQFGHDADADDDLDDELLLQDEAVAQDLEELLQHEGEDLVDAARRLRQLHSRRGSCSFRTDEVAAGEDEEIDVLEIEVNAVADQR